MEMKMLTNAQDQVGFAKTLMRQAIADGELAVREVGCIRALCKVHGVTDENAAQAQKEISTGNKALPEMSKSAVVASLMAALDLSMCDMDFSQDEVQTILALGKELGTPSDDNLVDALREYCRAHIGINTEMEKLISTLGGQDTGSIDQVFPTPADKKCFVKCMMKVANLDAKVVTAEDYFLKNVSASYGIGDATIQEALEEYKAGDFTFTVSSEFGKTAILRSAVRMACMDSDFDATEQAAVLTLGKELGMEVDPSVIEKIAQIAAGKHTIFEKKAAATQLWLSM